MMNYDLSEINNALKDATDKQLKAQQSKGEFMRMTLMNKLALAQEKSMYSWKQQQDMTQKKEMAPWEMQQEQAKKLLPSMTYKDTLFQGIKNKPQAQWEPWESQFMDTYTGGGEQAITDAQGNIIGYRPKKSVFQPKAGDADPFAAYRPGGGQPQTQPSGRMRVKIKGGTQTGTIDAGEFDPNKYEKI